MNDKKMLKNYTTTYFNQEIVNENLYDNIKLCINNNIFTSPGSFVLDRNLKKGKIIINLHSILHQKKDKVITQFEIINNIGHELEHAKTFINTRQDDFYSFEHLIALMEFIYCANTFNINPKKLSLIGYRLFKFKKLLDKNYDVSTSEINANLIGYKKALTVHDYNLQENDKKNIEQIIKSLEILKKNMEIYYDNLGGCNNKFSLFLENTAQYIRKYPEIYEEYKILQNLFNSDGTLKKIDEIYANTSEQNIEMNKKIITYYIISINDKYNNCFDDEKIKKLLEVVINEYILNSINYFKNMNKCKIFIDKPKVLSDNLLLKKKNIEVLNSFAERNGLNITSGTIIGNTTVGKQKHMF